MNRPRSFRSVARILAILCSASITHGAHAELADSLAAISAEHYPDAKNNGETESVQLSLVRANVGVPIKLSERTLMFAGAGYELIDVRPSGAASFQLHAPKLSVGAVHDFSERWGAIGLVGVGLASDFSESIGSRDLTLSLSGMVTYAFNKTTKVGAGVVFDARTGTLSPLPALLVDLRPLPRLRIHGFAPVWLHAEYKTMDWLDVGLRATFDGNRYHLGEKAAGLRDVELAYSNFSVGPKLTFHISDWVHLDVYAPIAAYRRYELFQNDDSIGRYRLSPVVGYGMRVWVAPSGW